MDGGDVEFSHLWVANSPEGTVSKIDTRLAREIGRYLVTPTPGGDPRMGPSRTSVNLRGDMAVADRDGGLTKIWAREGDCEDRNGNGRIDTSHDTEFLPWQDECVAWRVEIPRKTVDARGPRVVQWTAEVTENGCPRTDPPLWTAFCNAADDDVTVWLVDGVDGSIEVEIPISGYQCRSKGPYGGMVDDGNDLWFIDIGSAAPARAIYRVAYDCMPGAGEDCWEAIPIPEDTMRPYGVTLDRDGGLWMAGSANSLFSYHTVDGTWRNHHTNVADYFAALPKGTSVAENFLRGLMADDAGRLWIAVFQSRPSEAPGVLRVDTKSDPPGLEFFGSEVFGDALLVPAGVSIDVDGFVWVVDEWTNAAVKFDPDDPTNHEVVGGLTSPYTYSDMTGYGLRSVAVPTG